MKDQQDVQEFQQIQEELHTKDTTLEQELSKQIEEKKEIEKEVKAEVEEVHAPKEVKKEIVKEGIKEREKFGIETIRIMKEGVYEINIDALMKKRPLIILEKGKVYLIHLPSAFERFAKE
jgi:predicted  nucleic acid-binding Zn-ribbon protein